LRTGLLIVGDWCWPMDLDLCKIVCVLLAGFSVEEFGSVCVCCACVKTDVLQVMRKLCVFGFVKVV
jgi:hypothetical protein